jgi:hypothetical protein
MKMPIFWDVALCSLVEVYLRLEVLAASIIRAISNRLHRATSQKTVILKLNSPSPTKTQRLK